MSNETYKINIPCQCVKTYNVIRKSFRGQIYRGNVERIADWFYQTVDNKTNNITLILHGGIHQTFPNPQHLTVEFKYDGSTTGRLHMSVDDYGYWYQQPLSFGGRNNNSRPRKTHKSHKSSKSRKTRVSRK